MRKFLGILVLIAVISVGTAIAQKPKTPAAGPAVAEKILDASEAPAEAPLKPLKELAKFKLSNVRLEVPAPGQQALLKVRYELLTAGDLPNPVLVLRTADGKQRFIGARLFGRDVLKDKSGDITLGLGYARIGENTKELEAYLAFTDRRWEDEELRPTFKVSNSAVMGDLGRDLQYAREWTPEETKKLNNPPPTGPALNANNNIGKDTKFVGLVEKLTPSLRFASPKKTPVVGFHYTLGTFEPVKGLKAGCIVHLTPSFDQRQPSFGQKMEMAKPGYAVGAVNVKTNSTVTAIQVVYMKIMPNGTINAKDSYTGDWVGEPGPNDKEETLTGNGRKVIGTHVRHFGRVYALALVLE
ncbi:hypothetical protein [Zavarzinella formosa]|uniref:hypothetical protein n=1 Tax=Zavarzinella formosa TaxID=360055 RepID=UPI0003047A8B|nr:hypothetical protein [Zavarzinella formosa]